LRPSSERHKPGRTYMIGPGSCRESKILGGKNGDVDIAGGCNTSKNSVNVDEKKRGGGITCAVQRGYHHSSQGGVYLHKTWYRRVA